MHRAGSGRDDLLPGKGATVLILDDARLKEVLLLFEIHRFRHPWERIFSFNEDGFDAKLRAAAVGNEVHCTVRRARR